MDGRLEEAERLAGEVFAELQPYEPEIAAQKYGIIVFELCRHQGRLLEMEQDSCLDRLAEPDLIGEDCALG
jgi:hypothetical protein